MELIVAGIVLLAVVSIVIKVIKFQIKVFMFLALCMLIGAGVLYVKYGEDFLKWMS